MDHTLKSLLKNGILGFTQQQWISIQSTDIIRYPPGIQKHKKHQKNLVIEINNILRQYLKKIKITAECKK